MLGRNAMSAPAPLISVIVVCKNPGPQLRTVLASVRDQRDASVETLVIDGASTDGTCDWLRAEAPPDIRFLSEPDRGLYEAMNKGIAVARGTWVLFLGADDRLAGTEVLASAARRLRETPAEVVVGEACFDDGRRYPFAGIGTAVRRNFLHHQGAFYRRDSLLRHRGFDAGLRVMADYDLNLRLLVAGARFEPLALHVADCSSGGLSDAGVWLGYGEEIAVRHRYFSAWQCWGWDLGSIARWLRKRWIRRP